MALFVLASKDGWVSIMYTGLDAVGIDQQVCELVSWILILSIHFITTPSNINFVVLHLKNYRCF